MPLVALPSDALGLVASYLDVRDTLTLRGASVALRDAVEIASWAKASKHARAPLPPRAGTVALLVEAAVAKRGLVDWRLHTAVLSWLVPRVSLRVDRSAGMLRAEHGHHVCQIGSVHDALAAVCGYGAFVPTPLRVALLQTRPRGVPWYAAWTAGRGKPSAEVFARRDGTWARTGHAPSKGGALRAGNVVFEPAGLIEDARRKKKMPRAVHVYAVGEGGEGVPLGTLAPSGRLFVGGRHDAKEAAALVDALVQALPEGVTVYGGAKGGGSDAASWRRDWEAKWRRWP